MQLMGRNFIRSSPGINFRASFIQNYLCGLPFIMDDIDFASYSDNDTPYTIAKDTEMLFEIAKFVKNTFSIVYE